MKSFQAREAELNQEIMTINNTIVSIQAKNSIDEDEAKKIQELSEKRDFLKNKLPDTFSPSN